MKVKDVAEIRQRITRLQDVAKSFSSLPIPTLNIADDLARMQDAMDASMRRVHESMVATLRVHRSADASKVAMDAMTRASGHIHLDAIRRSVIPSLAALARSTDASKVAMDAMTRASRSLDAIKPLTIRRPVIPDLSALARSSMTFNETLRVRDNAIEDTLKTLSAGAMATSRAASFASMESLAESMEGFHARQFREMAALTARNERVWGGMPTERGRPVVDVHNMEDIAESIAERTTTRMLERERKWTSKEWLALALGILVPVAVAELWDMVMKDDHSAPPAQSVEALTPAIPPPIRTFRTLPP